MLQIVACNVPKDNDPCTMRKHRYANRYNARYTLNQVDKNPKMRAGLHAIHLCNPQNVPITGTPLKSTYQTMPNTPRNLRHSIEQNPDGFCEELCSAASDSEDHESIKATIKTVGELLAQERDLIEQRKRFSRKTGEAKKQNQDTRPLIARVANLSREVKATAENIDKNLELLRPWLPGEKTSETEIHLPAHLRTGPYDEDPQANSPHQQKVYVTKEFDAGQWQSYVAQHSASTVYHDARWHTLLHSNFRHSPYYLTAIKEDGSICGVLPLIHLKSRVFGSFAVSLPWFNYGGPLADSLAIEEQLLSFADDLSMELECTHFESRETRARPTRQSKQHKVTMILPLPPTDDLLDKQLGSKIRAQVNKTHQAGVSVVFGQTELLDDFYRVFSHNMRDLGTPVYNIGFFRDILTTFSEKAQLAVLYKDNAPLAAGFLIGHSDKLEIPWASSLRKFNHLGVNMYLYRSILRKAIENGYLFFDFGRSSIGASTHRFKKQWGAQEHTLHWTYWLKEKGDLPELNPQNPKYALAINVWRRLPVPIVNLIGPLLVRNLP